MLTINDKARLEGLGVSDIEELEKENHLRWVKNYCILIPKTNWYARDNEIILTSGDFYNIIDITDDGYIVKDNDNIKEIIKFQEIIDKKFVLFNKFLGIEM
jgi:predicted nucleic-acid-binding Zn-ribbon protein